MSRESDFITEARTHARNVWNGIYALQAMQAEWNALNYGSTLDDGAGDNAGLTKTEVGAAVFAASNALVVVLNGGQAANLAKLL